MATHYSLNPRKAFLQHLFTNLEDVRYGITASLFGHEIFAFRTAFGIKWTRKDIERCQRITRSLFSNINIVHDMVSKGCVVAILGKSIFEYQFLRLAMDTFVRQGQFNTGIKIYIAFVKLEKVTRRDPGDLQRVGDFRSVFPPITPEMVTAVEPDNPLVTFHLLNPSEDKGKTTPYVPPNLIGDIVHSKGTGLLVPYIVLSQTFKDPTRAEDFGFKYNTARITPGVLHSNQQPTIHMVFDFEGLNDNALERGKVSQYVPWDTELEGMAFLETCEAEGLYGRDSTLAQVSDWLCLPKNLKYWVR